MRATLLLGLILGTLKGLCQHGHGHAPVYDSRKAFTAEDMLAAPRPQAAIPSPDGLNAINVVDRWDPVADTTTRSVYILSLDGSSEPPRVLFESPPSEASEFLWLANDTIAYLNGSLLYSLPVNTTNTTLLSSKPTLELEFPEGINPGSLKYSPLAGVLAFSAQVWADGSFDSVARFDQAQQKQRDTGRVYDELYFRHWDTWRTPGKVWTIGITELPHGAKTASDASKVPLHNALNASGLYSQMDPIEFDLSATHLAINVKAPHLQPALHTRTDVYLFRLDGKGSSPKHLTPHAHGAISGVTLSATGERLAWLEMAEDGYESDRRVVVTYDLASKDGKLTRWTDNWDRSPSELTWALESDSLYFLAEHHGRILPYHLSHPDHLPTPLLFDHATVALSAILPKTLLLSINSFTSPTDIFLLHLDSQEKSEQAQADDHKDKDKLPREPLRRVTDWSSKFLAGRLDDLQIDEFWFRGAEDWDVMGWTIAPLGSAVRLHNDKNEGAHARAESHHRYPLAFLIHGGPQGAWEDSWSTRWNPALYAAQGYFVVAINPTGSTGYGQEFTDRIRSQWGGRPFKDLVAGYHAVLDAHPEIDPQRTAALGASYGGYMINWINGHNDAFKSASLSDSVSNSGDSQGESIFGSGPRSAPASGGFKALVCHDGIFDTLGAYYTTEEIFFPTHDLAGSPTSARATYERWNPMNHVGEWTTPQLVVHSAQDFRLVDGQGFAPFTALQVQGVPSRLLWFPDENHWVLKPHNSIRWHYEVFRWLDEWVGDQPETPLDVGAWVGEQPFDGKQPDPLVIQ